MDNLKFCKHCGEKIDKECVVCPICGKQVEELKCEKERDIIINNSASSSSNAVTPTRKKKKYNLLIDIIMFCITGGLWLIWILVRPKYEY